MRKLLIITAILALLTTPLVADQHTQTDGNVDTVILASTENYPDAMVASSAATKVGAPILLTEEDELTDEVSSSLEEMDPSEILLVGGDAVISDDVKESLEADYNVTRLWGVTRYGTAVEVADYFWREGSDSALLVENGYDDDERTLGLASSIARSNSEPVFLTQSDKIPASVMTALEDLGVSEVGFVGTSLSEEATSQLQDIGVTVRDRVQGGEDQIDEEIRQKLRERVNTSQEFVVVGATDYRHALAGTTDPGSNSYLVGGDEDIENVVTFVADEGIERVKVVGAPDMVEDIAESLREGTNATVTVRGMAANEVSRSVANISQGEIADIAKKQKKARAAWQERIADRQDKIMERANKSIAQIKDLAQDANASEEAWDDIAEVEAIYNAGDYGEAYEEARELVSDLREDEWDAVKGNPDRVRDRVSDETDDIEEHVGDLREINQEFAEEMQQNLTTEERLEIISKFKEKRHEAVEELVDEARGMRGELTERFREAERSVDGDIRTDFEQECADEDSPGVEELTAEFTGHDGYLRAEGNLGLSTPNYKARAKEQVDTEAREVTIDLVYSDFTRGSDMAGIQCTGVSEYEVRKYVDAGNWTIQLNARVDGQQVASASGIVTVRRDNDDEIGEDDEEGENESSQAPGVEADDQELEDDGTVELEGYLNEPGFVVVHADDDGQPGDIVANSGLLEGEFETNVKVGMNASGTYWAMLHYDDGDGEFVASADAPVTRLNETVQQAFAVTADGDDDGVNESDDETSSDDNVVTYSSDGFSPDEIEVEPGETVTWKSQGPDMWVASNEHPTHTEYDGTSTSEHCENETSSTFDACSDMDEYSFTFDKTGEWEYHNHVLSSHEGTVVVGE